MIDTQVLSFGLATEAAAKGTTMARQQRDCVALMKSLSAVRVSSIVVLELMKAPPQVVAKVRASGILDLLAVEPVDAAIALAAADLLEAARGHKGMCTRCFNMAGATTCSKCGQQVSHQQKTHDALIVATASILSDVDTLYSYDPGVLALGGFVKNVNVEEPPNLDGPLFSRK
jgi:predicted nucleic acid-binding protein